VGFRSKETIKESHDWAETKEGYQYDDNFAFLREFFRCGRIDNSPNGLDKKHKKTGKNTDKRKKDDNETQHNFHLSLLFLVNTQFTLLWYKTRV
jgi:hypothetical protein